MMVHVAFHLTGKWKFLRGYNISHINPGNMVRSGLIWILIKGYEGCEEQSYHYSFCFIYLTSMPPLLFQFESL